MPVGAEPAADIADALSLLDWAVSEDPDTGRTGLEWLRPILKPLLSEDGTWTTLNRAAGLMRYEDSATAGLLALIPPLLQLDPDLALMDQLGPLLGQRSVAAPLLRALEAPGVVDGLLTDTPEDGQTQAPTAFLGALIADGTFDDLLALVDLLLEDLGGVIDEVL